MCCSSWGCKDSDTVTEQQQKQNTYGHDSLLLSSKTSPLLFEPRSGNSPTAASPGFSILSTLLDYPNLKMPIFSTGILTDTGQMLEVVPGNRLIKWNFGPGLVMYLRSPKITSWIRINGTRQFMVDGRIVITQFIRR